jgi:hypothetical protein
MCGPAASDWQEKGRRRGRGRGEEAWEGEGGGGADGMGEEALPAAAVTWKSGPARRASATGGQVPPRSVVGEEKAVALKWKAPVRVSATSNVASISGLLTVDGVVLLAGDRVLLLGQT